MTTSLSMLRSRVDHGLPGRLARSAAVREGVSEIRDWLASRARASAFTVERIPFAAMDSWSFATGTGNLAHRTGKFFSIEGLDVTVDGGHWQQPVIVQPEIGILGILVKDIGGVLHCLMQAKMEPGNVNRIQLSPTVQATRSNYTKAHRGSAVHYLEHFRAPADTGRVLVDVLQSEHGSWFYRKSNRNMVVEAYGEVAEHPDFRWMTLGQLDELFGYDNIVNMDSRSVLACLPREYGSGQPLAMHRDVELVSWLTAQRTLRDVRTSLMPLGDVRGWRQAPSAIEHEQGKYFSVVAVAVETNNREVARWTQPLLAPHGLGVTAFLVGRIGGITHVLAHAHLEGGLPGTVEIGPTVDRAPINYGDQIASPFQDYVLGAAPSRTRYACVHSEEGGRFLNAQSRYLLIDVGDDVFDPPPGYLWLTPGQLSTLVRNGHLVNVQARTLLACLHGIGDELGEV